jgi:two-component sensor histidine kinase
MSVWDWLLNPAGLTPHGFCLSWAPGLVWLHAGSDAVIALAYFSVPLALAAFAQRRRDLNYSWVLYLFVAFILACGTTHLMSIVTLWFPAYGIEGLVKLVTALASIVTAIALWPLIPRLVALPSPAHLARLNAELTEKIGESQLTQTLLRESEARVRAANAELERRVEDQTTELRTANACLTEALEQGAGALKQRDILLREVYHRVKNNLQIMDGLLAAQLRNVTDKDALASLANLRQRLYAMGLVHQQLMESKDLRTFDIAPFLEELSNNVIESSAFHGLELSVQSIPLAVGVDFAVPLGLLVTELLTNSLKHAFPEGVGSISVVLERSGYDNLTLIVSDNGHTAESARLAPFASQPGRGINIITGLVRQLKGAIAMETSNGTRTEIYVAAPAQP